MALENSEARGIAGLIPRYQIKNLLNDLSYLEQDLPQVAEALATDMKLELTLNPMSRESSYAIFALKARHMAAIAIHCDLIGRTGEDYGVQRLELS